MLNLVSIQEFLFESLEQAITQPLYEQGVPDADTIRKVDGKVLPYVALQFGDLQDRLSGRSFSGVRFNDYELPIYIQVVSSDPKIARRIASGPILDAFLGVSSKWTGEVRKRPGGGMWPITNSNGATEAYLVPSSWGVTLQMSEE